MLHTLSQTGYFLKLTASIARLWKHSRGSDFTIVTMAPDADKLRQRKTQQVVGASDEDATRAKVGSLQSLAGTEVVIDGVIYDIADFDHPGGESIKVFGGNDVTVTYKMIHPHHNAKHLEKMKAVGKVPDYVSE